MALAFRAKSAAMGQSHTHTHEQFVQLSWVVLQSWRVGELFLTLVFQLQNLCNAIAQEHGLQ
jgi:hypothetical protein